MLRSERTYRGAPRKPKTWLICVQETQTQTQTQTQTHAPNYAPRHAERQRWTQRVHVHSYSSCLSRSLSRLECFNPRWLFARDASWQGVSASGWKRGAARQPSEAFRFGSCCHTWAFSPALAEVAPTALQGLEGSARVFLHVWNAEVDSSSFCFNFVWFISVPPESVFLLARFIL